VSLLDLVIYVGFPLLGLGFLGLVALFWYQTRRFDQWCAEGRISPRDQARYEEVGGILGGFTHCDPIGPPGTYPPAGGEKDRG
jgi:hypothetical protein